LPLSSVTYDSVMSPKKKKFCRSEKCLEVFQKDAVYALARKKGMSRMALS